MKICFFLFILHVKIHVIAILTKNTFKKNTILKPQIKLFFQAYIFRQQQ
jgi:hypothetical protein